MLVIDDRDLGAKIRERERLLASARLEVEHVQVLDVTQEFEFGIAKDDAARGIEGRVDLIGLGVVGVVLGFEIFGHGLARIRPGSLREVR